MPKERLLMLFIAVVAIALLLSAQNKAPEARATFRANIPSNLRGRTCRRTVQRASISQSPRPKA